MTDTNDTTNTIDWKNIKIGDVIDYDGSVYQVQEKKPGGVMAHLVKSNGGFFIETVAITYAWMKHNLKTVYSKEEYPEYFL